MIKVFIVIFRINNIPYTKFSQVFLEILLEISTNYEEVYEE